MNEFGVARDHGLNANFRVRAPEASEDSGQHRLAEILLHPEPGQTLELYSPNRPDRFVVEIDHASRVGEHRFTGERQREAASGPDDERVVSRRRASVMLYERWRWTLRSRFVGGGFKPP